MGGKAFSCGSENVFAREKRINRDKIGTVNGSCCVMEGACAVSLVDLLFSGATFGLNNDYIVANAGTDS